MTRTEVIVIILVAVVLLALALPWLVATREDDRVVNCKDNLRQIGLAVGEYAVDNGKVFPYGTWQVDSLPPEQRFAWTIAAASYRKDGKVVLSVYDLAKPWNDAANLNPTGGDDAENNRFRRMLLFHCPADENLSADGELISTSYVGMAGLGEDAASQDSLTRTAGLWGYKRQTHLRQITDGLEVTVSVIDTSRNNGPWTAGGPSTLRGLVADRKPYFGANGQFGGHHSEGAIVLFASGHVKIFSPQTAPEAFVPLCTPAGGN